MGRLIRVELANKNKKRERRDKYYLYLVIMTEEMTAETIDTEETAGKHFDFLISRERYRSRSPDRRDNRYNSRRYSRSRSRSWRRRNSRDNFRRDQRDRCKLTDLD